MVAALAFSGLVSHGAWASEGSALPVANTLSSEDLNFAFAPSSEPVELVALSEQEMRETEGAVLQYAVGTGLWTLGGGLVGVGVYGWNTYSTGDSWSWGSAGRAFGSGATAGFYSSPLIGTALRPVGAFVGGALGAGAWYSW